MPVYDKGKVTLMNKIVYDLIQHMVIFCHLALFSLRTESDNPDATCELSP